MFCPQCGSQHISIDILKGWEMRLNGVKVEAKHLKEHRCEACGSSFWTWDPPPYEPPAPDSA